MTETKAAPAGLYAALAKFQAELPEVTKDSEADAGTYSYSYAALDAVSKKAMPKLGRLGLSFSARPTLNAKSEFVLAYTLAHESGQTIGGEYPLPSPERTKPQQVGSAISYGRRYTFCAVTGIAPKGDDDDGKAAQDAPQDAWQNAAPARPRRTREAPPDGSEWETAKPAGEPVTDMDWMTHLVDDLIPAAKDTDTLNDYWAEINQHVDEGKCTPAHAREIKAFIRERGQELGFTSKQPEPNGKQPEEAAAS